MNIVLIGYRGCGKTTVGRALALRLGREFVDTDELVTRRAGKTIREIFAEGGEAAFREHETAVIERIAGRSGLVVAVGGGAVLRPGNVAALKRDGCLVWLQADVGALFERIQADAGTAESRPNLTAAGGIEEVEKLLSVRTPHYRAAADMTVDVGQVDVKGAVEAIARLFESRLESISGRNTPKKAD